MNAEGRVLGWDLLRGLSAIAVAAYHLMYWQGLASLHAWGSYGVYLFFVLSGASLAYTYAPRMADGQFRFLEFLRVRYVRLAPLYVLLVLTTSLPAWLLDEGWSTWLVKRLLLNVTFSFGVDEPVMRAFLVGGWSLGIEALFYVLFPVLLYAALSVRWGVVLFVVLAGVQVAWVHRTVGAPAGYAANAVLYHHLPAFLGWFMGGCLLGVLQRRSPHGGDVPGLAGAALLVGAFATLAVLNPPDAGDELLNWRGPIFALLCFGMVALAARLQLRRWTDRLATVLGDATYGLYLLHPVLFFQVGDWLLPQLGLGEPKGWPVAARAGYTVLLLFSAFGLALLSERRLERPLREWSKRRATARPQSDSASIRS